MGCTCDHMGTCGLCRAIKTAPDYCSCGDCEKCHTLADEVYRLQHPEPVVIRICTGCGNHENHSNATSCQTCQARYRTIIHEHVGKTMTLWTHDMNVMVYGQLKYHLPTHYMDLPEYMRPMCVDNLGHAYVQFKPTQIVNVHTYQTASAKLGMHTAIMIVVKL